MQQHDNTADRLGDALHAAIATEITASTARRRERRPRRKLPRMRIAIGLAAAALALPAVALATGVFSSDQEVAQSIPAGTLALLGTEPTCTTLRAGTEYHCVLAKEPGGELEPSTWKGVVEPTVDATRHVNGGCRSENADGTEWRCYLGTEAVHQQIIGPDLLGGYSAGPGVG